MVWVFRPENNARYGKTQTGAIFPAKFSMDAAFAFLQTHFLIHSTGQETSGSSYSLIFPLSINAYIKEWDLRNLARFDLV